MAPKTPFGARSRARYDLRRNSYRGGNPAALLLARLHAAAVPAAHLPTDTLALMIRTQVTLLRSIQTAIADLENLIRQRVDEHPRAQLLAALPGVGTINLAEALAEIGPILDRVDTVDQAGGECGVTPVTKASGKTSGGDAPAEFIGQSLHWSIIPASAVVLDEIPLQQRPTWQISSDITPRNLPYRQWFWLFHTTS